MVLMIKITTYPNHWKRQIRRRLSQPYMPSSSLASVPIHFLLSLNFPRDKQRRVRLASLHYQPRDRLSRIIPWSLHHNVAWRLYRHTSSPPPATTARIHSSLPIKPPASSFPVISRFLHLDFSFCVSSYCFYMWRSALYAMFGE